MRTQPLENSDFPCRQIPNDLGGYRIPDRDGLTPYFSSFLSENEPFDPNLSNTYRVPIDDLARNNKDLSVSKDLLKA